MKIGHSKFREVQNEKAQKKINNKKSNYMRKSVVLANNNCIPGL